MNDIKTAKLKLQEELLDLIVKFEKEWDANVYCIDMQKDRIVGERINRTVYLRVGVEV